MLLMVAVADVAKLRTTIQDKKEKKLEVGQNLLDMTTYKVTTNNLNMDIEKLINEISQPQYAEESDPPPSEQVTPDTADAASAAMDSAAAAQQQHVIGPNDPTHSSAPDLPADACMEIDGDDSGDGTPPLPPPPQEQPQQEQPPQQPQPPPPQQEQQQQEQPMDWQPTAPSQADGMQQVPVAGKGKYSAPPHLIATPARDASWRI